MSGDQCPVVRVANSPSLVPHQRGEGYAMLCAVDRGDMKRVPTGYRQGSAALQKVALADTRGQTAAESAFPHPWTGFDV